jgi:hypothetical protein
VSDTAAPAPYDTVPSSPTAPVTSARPRTVAAARTHRVRRVVRRIEPVSVLKVSAVFYACVFTVVLVAGIVVWLGASGAGVVGNVETFLGDLLALDEFRFEAWQILRWALVGGVILVALGTGANVLAVVLFNLIADRVGGVEVTLVEDDASASRSVV